MTTEVKGPNRTFILRIWYQLVRNTMAAILIITCGVRASGRKEIPETGPTLFMANHASYYDTIVMGVVQRRLIDFMARSGLFIPFLGALITSMGAFAIQRDGGGAAGIKETLKRLKKGRMIGLYPEGTRTHDGKIQPLRPGIASIAKKSSSNVLCAGIYGAFQAWPRTQPWPGAFQLHVHYVETIKPDDLLALNDEQSLALMQQRLEQAHAIAGHEVHKLRSFMVF